ncbi:MAG: hypothetical protein HQ518_20465 [Rhodopirellula sp.]|nr:hypothetical protein [Rhodopirellula sp.]
MSHSCFQGTVSQGVFETFFEAIVRVVAAGELITGWLVVELQRAPSAWN